mmetsp:Transcript_107902/g.271397  ORF Transcript_107902/g.271397 Transcript_107902/m.271397 type:complete len:92 (-) Transcript_107902:215-490(-)
MVFLMRYLSFSIGSPGIYSLFQICARNSGVPLAVPPRSMNCGGIQLVEWLLPRDRAFVLVVFLLGSQYVSPGFFFCSILALRSFSAARIVF